MSMTNAEKTESLQGIGTLAEEFSERRDAGIDGKIVAVLVMKLAHFVLDLHRRMMALEAAETKRAA